MKTIRLLTTFLLITLCIGLTACSSGDDNERDNINSGIVGTWEGGNYDYEVTFNADGSFESYDNGELVISGKYSINGDEIVLKADGEIVYFTILSLEEDTLILKDESGYKSILNRITNSDEGNVPTTDNEESTSIIGTWEGDNYDYVITFNADGSFESYDNGELVISGEYSINGDEIVLKADGEIVYCTILSLEEDTLILKDESGYKSILNRITNSDEGNVPTTDNEESISIIGTWIYEEDDYISKITFKRDGTFTLIDKEYYNGEWDEYTITGEYKYKNDELELIYDNERDNIEIVSLTSTRLTIKSGNEEMTFKKE